MESRKTYIACENLCKKYDEYNDNFIKKIH